MSDIHILTVLKSSPSNLFGYDYVTRIYNALRDNTRYDFRFCCFTDMYDDIPDFVYPIPLRYDLPRWWSKIEIFRTGIFEPGSPLLYFDLDEVVLDCVDELFELIISLKFPFMMQRGFNRRALLRGNIPASGIIGWKAGCNQANLIFTEFMKNSQEIMKRKYSIPGQNGDQGFIGDLLGWDTIPKLQDYLPSNYITGKRFLDKKATHFPNVRIASWSGKPRLRDSDIPWIRKWWNKYA